MLSSTNDAIVQSPRQPQTVNAKFRRMSMPRSVCTTSGWNSTPNSLAARSCMPAIGALADVAVISNPAGGAATRSPWLAQTRTDAGRSANRHRRAADPPARARIPAAARASPVPRAYRSSTACRSRCRASACPTAGPPDRREARRRRRRCADRPTGSARPGWRRAISAAGVLNGRISEYTDSSRRRRAISCVVLRTEIEDDNRLMGHADGPVAR